MYITRRLFTSEQYINRRENLVITNTEHRNLIPRYSPLTSLQFSCRGRQEANAYQKSLQAGPKKKKKKMFINSTFRYPKEQHKEGHQEMA